MNFIVSCDTRKGLCGSGFAGDGASNGRKVLYSIHPHQTTIRLQLLLPSPKEVMFLVRSVCLSVCLSVCPSDN